MIAELFILIAHPVEPPKRVALTFDDVPRHAGAWFSPDERTKKLITELDAAGVEQAAFFVTPGNLEKEQGEGGEERIAAYVAAGHVIANHSYSHLWSSRTDTADYRANIDKAAEWLEGRDGYRPWYRFPYLDEGGWDLKKRDAYRAGLAERGLMNGYVTIDNYDWSLDAHANKAKREGREVDVSKLCGLYAETLVETSNFNDDVAREHLGRSPAHVLLLHETDIAANCIGTLIEAYHADGWEIIAADEAFADPLSQIEPDTWFLGSGRIAAIAHVNGVAARDLVHERTDEEMLEMLFEERVMRGNTEEGDQ